MSSYSLQTARRLAVWLTVPMGVLAGATVAAWADVPNAFKAGDLLSANTLNANFVDIDKWRARPVVTRGGKKYSLGATYCGSTTTTTNGQITQGYAGTKVLCEAVAACSNSPSAHMCTSDEMVRSSVLGIVPAANVWFSAGGGMFYNGTYDQDDCGGWVSASNTRYGAFWSGQFNHGSATVCTATMPVACCD